MNELTASDSVSGVAIGRPTITARLSKEKQDLQKRLNNVTRALELMEKNPEMAELMDALGRTYL